MTRVGISEWRSLQMSQERIGLCGPIPDKGGGGGGKKLAGW